jgi:hypothetical protein
MSQSEPDERLMEVAYRLALLETDIYRQRAKHERLSRRLRSNLVDHVNQVVDRMVQESDWRQHVLATQVRNLRKCLVGMGYEVSKEELLELYENNKGYEGTQPQEQAATQRSPGAECPLERVES